MSVTGASALVTGGMSALEMLFNVHVINPYNGEVVIDGKVVAAESENDAIRKSGVEKIAYEMGVQLEELQIYVSRAGTSVEERP